MDELFELAERVEGRIVTYRFAVSYVTGRDWSGLTEADMRVVGRLVVADLDREPGRAAVLAHLAVLAAAARWGEDRDSPWWLAADLYVEATRQRLSRVPDGDRLLGAIEVADRQIAVLDGRIAVLRRRLFRRDRELIDREEQERADTLLGAASLVLGPYLAHQEALDGWLDPIGPGRRNILPTPDAAEPYTYLPGNIQVREDAEKFPMPPPSRAAEVALAYLDQALATAHGRIRGLCLFQKVEALSFLWSLSGADFALKDLLLASAREALHHLDGERDPESRLAVVELLVREGVMTVPDRPADLLAVPFGDLARRHGPDGTVRILIRLGHLARGLRTLTEIRATAEAVLDEVVYRPLVLAYHDLAVHLLPENTYPCPGPALKVGRATVEAALPRLTAMRRRSPAEAAATLLHMISHIRVADTPTATALLGRVANLDPGFAEANRWLMLHLSASARRRYAEFLTESGEPQKAFREYGDVAPDLMRLWGHLRQPSTLVREFVQDVFRRCAPVPEPEKATQLASLLLAVLVHTVPSLTPSGSPQHEGFVHSFGILVDQRLRRPEVATSALSFVQHCLFKGVDLGILLHNAPSRTVGPYSAGLLREIRAREAVEGPYVPPRVDEIEENVEWLPSGMSALYHVALGESAPESTAEGATASLRKAFDRSFTRDLLSPLRNGSSIRDSFAELRRVQRLLPRDTVLVSLFLGEVSGTATSEVPFNDSCLTLLAVTSDDCRPYQVNLHDLAGLVAMTSGDELVQFHPLARHVAELRLHLTADTGGRPLGPYARQLLERHHFLLGGPPAQLLEEWRAEGRTHLCIWPHGPLHYVPFPLLHHNGRPLADDWTVTTIPTPAVLTDPTPPPAPTDRRIVFAGTADGHPAFGLAPQPAVSVHVSALAARVRPSTLLVDGEVTPSALLAAAERATHLHIAAHGSHDTQAAWFQCLYLNPDPDNDGRLFAFQVAQADLSAVELVTLSACESAMGRYDLNDNLRGLPAAFLLAGAATVVGALWPVGVGAATTFFERLYLCLSDGDGKREAFRTAQRVTRERHPAYRDWGAFTFSGRW